VEVRVLAVNCQIVLAQVQSHQPSLLLHIPTGQYLV
jgi:hypothetical protein